MTIRELAEIAGFSHTTVSRALNGSPLIARETRDLILQLARQYGYQINAGARSLATGLYKTIGILYPYHRLRPQASWYTTQLLHKIRVELQDRGFDTLIGGYDTTDSVSDITRLVAQKKVDGLIISGYEISETAADAIRACTNRYLLLNPPHESWIDRHPCILIDQAFGGALAAKAIYDAGRKHVAIVAQESKQYRARMEGFAEELAKLRIDFDPGRDYFCIPSGAYEDAYNTSCKEIGRLRRYDALFVGCDLHAIGVINCLRDEGISVPADISVVGFDDIEWAHYVRPALTTIHQPCSEAAIAAAEEIVERVLQRKSEPTYRVLQPTLVKRDSC